MAWYSKVTQAPSRKLKILVVHEISYVEKVIYEVHEFPEILSTRGHDITFIDFAEGYRGRPGGNRRTWDQKGRVYDDAKLTIHSPWLSGVSGIDRLVALVSIWPVLWRLRKQKFDVILNYAVPTYGIQLNLWARALGIPVVHRALDVSHKIRQSIWNPAIELVENIVFKMSHSISTNNPAMADYVSRVSKRHGGQIPVHYPPTYNSDWKPKPFSTELAKSLGLTRSDTVIGYLGSFFYFSGLPDVVECLSRLDDQKRKVKLLLVGGGEQDRELRELVANKGLSERVIFTGFIDFSEIPTYLSLFDVGINPMHPLDVSNYALPNKVIQYLAMGVPVASTKLNGLYSSLEACNFVNWVESPEQILGAALDSVSPGRQGNKERLGMVECVAKFEKTESSAKLEDFLGLVATTRN
jgi:glycosyltransferase involved in cell wall biosynthesis